LPQLRSISRRRLNRGSSQRASPRSYAACRRLQRCASYVWQACQLNLGFDAQQDANCMISAIQVAPCDARRACMRPMPFEMRASRS
jgi:hypothetical protein